jgi:hypothetical protein
MRRLRGPARGDAARPPHPHDLASGGARLVMAVVRDYLDDEPGTLRSISWGLGP